MSNKKSGFSMKGKGYYIALVLCAVAIGISGYLYYSSANKDADADVTAGVTDPVNQDMQVVATQGGEDTPDAPTANRSAARC